MNPFNNTLDWSFRGKHVRVHGTNRVYEGWVDRIHHKRSSVVLHDATDVTGDRERDLGSVYVRVVETIEVLSPSKTIELVSLCEIESSPLHDQAFEASDEDMRAAYRDQFAGSYPVVRPIDDPGRAPYELLNGHKRIEACRRVGLDAHPVEIVEATDEEARELFELAHRDQITSEENTDADDESATADSADDGLPTGDESTDEKADLEYTENG